MLVALAPCLFFDISISWSTDESVSKTVPNSSFLSFPPDYPALSFFVFRRIESGSSFLVVPPDWIRLFLLRILPDVIRLLPIPALHCPVPASSASGLLSLLPRLVLCAPPPLVRFFLSPFPPDWIRLFFFLVVPPDWIRLFLLRIPPDWSRLFLLRVLPDVIRLLPIPAPRCPVPASSYLATLERFFPASGLLSLFFPPCPVRATSAGVFFVTSGAFLLPKTPSKSILYINI